MYLATDTNIQTNPYRFPRLSKKLLNQSFNLANKGQSPHLERKKLAPPLGIRNGLR